MKNDRSRQKGAGVDTREHETTGMDGEDRRCQKMTESDWRGRGGQKMTVKKLERTTRTENDRKGLEKTG